MGNRDMGHKEKKKGKNNSKKIISANVEALPTVEVIRRGKKDKFEEEQYIKFEIRNSNVEARNKIKTFNLIINKTDLKLDNQDFRFTEGPLACLKDRDFGFRVLDLNYE